MPTITPQMEEAIKRFDKNHDEAWQLAWSNQGNSNLARCYIDLAAQQATPATAVQAEAEKTGIHVDDVIYQPNKWPDFLIAFITFHRLPAVEKMNLERCGMKPPEVWADNPNGVRCRLTMASRMGDVGVNYTGEPTGYKDRFTLNELTGFRRQRKP
jgi:hypothetical protein